MCRMDTDIGDIVIGGIFGVLFLLLIGVLAYKGCRYIQPHAT
jgi:hypothetical protein